MARTWLARCRIGAGVALPAGLALTAIALGIALSASPSRVAGTNAVALDAQIGLAGGRAITACQADESLPRSTSAIRLSLEATVGPSVAVGVLSGGRVLTQGARGSGWTGASVTVPVRALDRAVSQVTVCVALGRSRIPVTVLGARTSRAVAIRSVGGHAMAGRVRIEYLRAGDRSWWSQAIPVARRMGLGRAPAGTWVSLLALALMSMVVLLVSRLVIREARAGGRENASHGGGGRRIVARLPGAAWTCAVVAFLNAACWSVITPPFQVPDESNHFTYVQFLAENGRLPPSSLGGGSPELLLTLEDLHSAEISFAPQTRSLAGEAQQRKLESELATPRSRMSTGGAGTAGAEPPLYYGLELIPYELGSGGSILERLDLMRLLSALMAAVTALFGYLFVRETLPRSRWTWTVGGLAVALFPLLGFMSGGVNPDAMLFAVCAALYYCLARAYRRGLTPRLAATIGAVTAVGFLTKLNFVGFAPGVALGMALLALRAKRGGAVEGSSRRSLYRSIPIALAIAGSPVLLYGLVNLLSNHPALGAASGPLNDTRQSFAEEISYIWQFYLPRLPGMHAYFPGISTTRQLWFDGLVGLYGWADTLSPLGHTASR